jgi:hypothetical protein
MRQGTGYAVEELRTSIVNNDHLRALGCVQAMVF